METTNQEKSQEIILEKQEVIKPARDEKGRLLPGNTANPLGRTKGKTLKEYARDYFLLQTEEEKEEYLKKLEEKKPGFIWQMAEGMPHQTTDVTSGNKPIPLLNVFNNNSDKEDTPAQEEN